MKRLIQMGVMAGLTITPMISIAAHTSPNVLSREAMNQTYKQAKQTTMDNTILSEVLYSNWNNSNKLTPDSLWYYNPYNTKIKNFVSIYHEPETISLMKQKFPDKNHLSASLSIVKGTEQLVPMKIVNLSGIEYTLAGVSTASENKIKQDSAYNLKSNTTAFLTMMNTKAKDLVGDSLAEMIIKNNHKAVVFTPKQKEQFIKQHRLVAAAIIDNQQTEKMIRQVAAEPGVTQQSLFNKINNTRVGICVTLRATGMADRNIECSSAKPLTINDYVRMGMDIKLYEKYTNSNRLVADSTIRRLTKEELKLLGRKEVTATYRASL